MEVEEEWSALASPYRAEAELLGFRFLERNIRTGIPPSPDTTFLCSDFLFDGQSTFLDVSGVLARGPHHRGLLIGLNGIQLYTFLHTPALTLVLTNGMAPAAAARMKKGCNPLIRRMFPDEIAMRGPEDMSRVLDRHRERVDKRGGEPLEVTGPPLEFRWRMMEEWEKDGSW